MGHAEWQCPKKQQDQETKALAERRHREVLAQERQQTASLRRAEEHAREHLRLERERLEAEALSREDAAAQTQRAKDAGEALHQSKLKARAIQRDTSLDFAGRWIRWRGVLLTLEQWAAMDFDPAQRKEFTEFVSKVMDEIEVASNELGASNRSKLEVWIVLAQLEGALRANRETLLERFGEPKPASLGEAERLLARSREEQQRLRSELPPPLTAEMSTLSVSLGDSFRARAADFGRPGAASAAVAQDAWTRITGSRLHQPMPVSPSEAVSFGAYLLGLLAMLFGLCAFAACFISAGPTSSPDELFVPFALGAAASGVSLLLTVPTFVLRHRSQARFRRETETLNAAWQRIAVDLALVEGWRSACAVQLNDVDWRVATLETLVGVITRIDAFDVADDEGVALRYFRDRRPDLRESLEELAMAEGHRLLSGHSASGADG